MIRTFITSAAILSISIGLFFYTRATRRPDWYWLEDIYNED